MVKITNGSITLKVGEGAYRNYFKRRGFYTVNSAGSNEGAGVYPTPPEKETHQEDDFSQQETDEEEDEDTEDPDEDEDTEDLSEIPLSDMNKEQLVSYAERLGLDPEDLTKKELRELIREHLEQ